jgi:hypothetical protein
MEPSVFFLGLFRVLRFYFCSFKGFMGLVTFKNRHGTHAMEPSVVVTGVRMV